MKNTDSLDQLLKHALSPDLQPDQELNQKIIYEWKENGAMKHSHKKKLTFLVLAATLTLLLSATAFAAWKFLTPGELAQEMGSETLAAAFDSNDALKINQSQTSGDYIFTLLGLVSGEGLSEYDNSLDYLETGRTYAVLSIENKDGTPMPSTADDAYGEVPFLISPLIQGLAPWNYNIFTMNGAHFELVRDGITYRLLECDGIDVFADRDIYLACIVGSSFYERDAFLYDEATGSISQNPDYPGATALFHLPLDPAKADPAKAQAYIDQIQESMKSPSDMEGENTDETSQISEDNRKMLELLDSQGTVIPDSVKVLTKDSKGLYVYEYNGNYQSMLEEWLFRDGQTGYSDNVFFTCSEGPNGKNNEAVRFHRDEQGVITAETLTLPDDFPMDFEEESY